MNQNQCKLTTIHQYTGFLSWSVIPERIITSADQCCVSLLFLQQKSIWKYPYTCIWKMVIVQAYIMLQIIIVREKKPWMTYWLHSFIIGLALFTTFFLIISSAHMISIIVLKFWQHHANIHIAISFSQIAKAIGGGLPNSASCRWIAKQLRFLGKLAKYSILTKD